MQTFRSHTLLGRVILIHSKLETDIVEMYVNENSAFWKVKVKAPDEDVATLFDIPTTATQLLKRASTSLCHFSRKFLLFVQLYRGCWPQSG